MSYSSREHLHRLHLVPLPLITKLANGHSAGTDLSCPPGLTSDPTDTINRSLQGNSACTHYEDGHCLTCSDQAIPVKVLHVNHKTGLAQVAVGDETEEIDITLVENVTPGDTLLAHGGVAIERLDR
jgi:hydrogenase maturation factor